VKNRKKTSHKGSSFSNVILISLDCARPESFSCYNYNKKTLFSDGKPKTPNIDAISKSGVTFTQAISQAPFTPASHASILTGTNPPTHGIRRMVGNKLSVSTVTLATILRDNGFKTGGFVSSSALGKHYGLARGFDVYDEEAKFKLKDNAWGKIRFCRETTDKAIEWLMKDDNKNFFLFIHYFDAHRLPLRAFLKYPFESESKNRLFQIDVTKKIHIGIRRFLLFFNFLVKYIVLGKNKSQKRHYLDQIKLIDRQIGRLVNFLKEKNIFDDTIIVIVSDHGESFGEHGEIGHRSFLYDATVKIPLIIKSLDNLNGLKIFRQVRSIDIAPTILDQLNIKVEPDFDTIEGTSLANIIKQNIELLAYSETCEEVSKNSDISIKHQFNALRTENWKFIIDKLTGKRELYDLINDPDEIRNVFDREPKIAQKLENKLMDVKGNQKQDITPIEQHEEELLKEHLKALGYI
jgi:arylsulfatase A-like enzyme